MLRACVDLLVCPVCDGPLREHGRTLGCDVGHRFDIARQGHVNLMGGAGSTHGGDSAEMVAARQDLLGGGHYDPLITAVAAAGSEAARGGPSPHAVADLGAGNGHYLAATLDRLDAAPGLALDVSAYALRRAAARHERIGAVACDAWQRLPVRDAAVACVLNVFAPRNGAEIARILAPGGQVVVVTPTTAHLREISEPLGMLRVDERKDARVAEALEPHLAPGHREEVTWRMTLGHGEIADLVAMGPTAFHRSPAQIRAAVRQLDEPLGVTGSVTLARWQARS